MDGQTIVITSLQPLKPIVNIMSSFTSIRSEVDKDGVPVIHCPIFLSPLMLISDLKTYIISEISDIVETDSITSNDIIIWSSSSNIEYKHLSKIYTPDMQTKDFVKSDFIEDFEIFEKGPIYVSGMFGELKYKEFKGKQSIKLTDSFFKDLYGKSFLTKDIYKLHIEYSNVYRSIFKYSDYYKIRSCIDNKPKEDKVICTIFFRNNDKVIMSGDIIPVRIPHNNFIIVISRVLASGNLQELITITDNKIIVQEQPFFETFILELIQKYPNIIVPERYYNSVKYNCLLDVKISNSYTEYENIFLYFNQSSTWNADNILQSKNKQLSIFLSSYGLKIRTSTPQEFLVNHVIQLLLGYSSMTDVDESSVKFDKIQGIYWSRICQNTGSVIRKPIKVLETDNPTDVINTQSQVNIDGEVFRCLQASTNKFIGFLTKPYELSSICLPCCYQTNQVNKKTYKKCTEMNTVVSSMKELYSLFIINSGRLISNNRLSFLEDISDTFLNSKSSIALDNKLLLQCVDYFLVTGFESISIDSSIPVGDYIINYLKVNPQDIIIHNFSFHTSMFIDKTQLIRYKTIVKSFLYSVICITKAKESDTITIKKSYQINPFIKTHKYTIPTHIQYITNTIEIDIDNTSKKYDSVLVADSIPNNIPLSLTYNELYTQPTK